PNSRCALCAPAVMVQLGLAAGPWSGAKRHFSRQMLTNSDRWSEPGFARARRFAQQLGGVLRVRTLRTWSICTRTRTARNLQGAGQASARVFESALSRCLGMLQCTHGGCYHAAERSLSTADFQTLVVGRVPRRLAHGHGSKTSTSLAEGVCG